MDDAEQLFEAVHAGDVPRARALVARNPGVVHARDMEGATALHYAAFHGHRELVALLHQAGGDINARDGRFDATPTGWAIEYLRELGGVLAMEIKELLCAIRERDVRWARRLVCRRRALITTADANGVPLRQHAEESADPDLIALFQSPPDGAGNP